MITLILVYTNINLVTTKRKKYLDPGRLYYITIYFKYIWRNYNYLYNASFYKKIINFNTFLKLKNGKGVMALDIINTICKFNKNIKFVIFYITKNLVNYLKKNKKKS